MQCILLLTLFVSILSLLNGALIENYSELSEMNVINFSDEQTIFNSMDDFLSQIFNERALASLDTELLIRLFESEMRGQEVLPGRKVEIENNLRRRIENGDMSLIINALIYAHAFCYEKALMTIVETVSNRFDEILGIIHNLKKGIVSEQFIEDLHKYKENLEKDASYVLLRKSDAVVSTRPLISKEEVSRLKPKKRLPAVIRQILDLPAKDSEVTSSFIRNNVLGRFDLCTILYLYEIEMSDMFHSQDTEGSIEKDLKQKILFESNSEMARLAFQMFIEENWHALKLIIDEKFSYESLISDPIWFQDLEFLFKYSATHYFPKTFNAKVLEMAKPSAIRRYNAKVESRAEKEVQETAEHEIKMSAFSI